MIRARYTATRRSAEPVIEVLLGHPDGEPAARSVPDLLDTGADRTVIPLTVAGSLSLAYAGTKTVEVAGGSVVTFPLYEVSVRIVGVMDFVLDVVASDGEPRVLLGRNVLNCLYTALNGPAHILELSSQPPATP